MPASRKKKPLRKSKRSPKRQTTLRQSQKSKIENRKSKIPAPTPASNSKKPPRSPSPHGLRIAAIDIGTNSLHMIIVEVTDSLSFRVLSSDKDLTKLGSAALVHHHLTKRAIDNTLDVLARYQRIATGLDCDVILAYATSAVRESTNGGDFVEAARNRLNLRIQVISAHEEAHLIYLAVRQAIDLSSHPNGNGPSLIIDIGGGSAELIVATNEKPLLLESFKLGASRLTQQFVHSDPISNKNLHQLESHLRKTLKPTLEQIKSLKPLRVIGTSGTLENLVSLAVSQHGSEIIRHRLLTHMTQSDFHDVYKKLLRLPLPERKHLPGLDPDRADQISAGAVLVNYLFEKLDISHIDVCDRAMREGMIIDYMQTHWPKVKLSVQIRDPRRRSCFELARRCNFDEKHALQVTKLALALFDSLQSFHKLSAHDRELLEFASLLHDIGWHIGHSGHHKHSAYLIKNGDLEAFSENELDLLANIARYHRKSPPKKSHHDYTALSPKDRETVWKLAGILRIADGLDRGHYNNVTSLRTIARSDTISIQITTTADAELELWAARHKTDMFEQIFHRQTKFSAQKSRR